MCYLSVVTAHCCRAAPVSVRRPTSSSCSQPLWSPPRGRLRPPLAGAELDRLRGARSLGDALARRLVRRRGVGRAHGNAACLARTARRLGAVGGADARRGAPRRGLCRGACSVRVLTRYVPWAYRGWGPNTNGDNVRRVKSRVWSVLTYLLTCAGGRAGVAASDTLVVGAGLGHARLVGLRLRLLRKYK